MSLRTPNANILRELPERDREWAARGDRFAGSADERHYGAELLGRAIGRAADMEATQMTGQLRALVGMGASTDTDADIAAAADVTRWQEYAALAVLTRPATAAFPPALRLTVAASAGLLAKL